MWLLLEFPYGGGAFVGSRPIARSMTTNVIDALANRSRFLQRLVPRRISFRLNSSEAGLHFCRNQQQKVRADRISKDGTSSPSRLDKGSSQCIPLGLQAGEGVGGFGSKRDGAFVAIPAILRFPRSQPPDQFLNITHH